MHKRSKSLAHLAIPLATAIPILLSASAANTLNAQILGEAELAMPAQTQALEYDHLAALRNLRNYAALKQQFAGVVLDNAQRAAADLGIQEGEVDEIVLGSTPEDVYTLFAGKFSGSTTAKDAVKRHISRVDVDGTTMLCPRTGNCVLFLEDSVAAFGTAKQLIAMLEARQGIRPSLASNRDLVALITASDRQAPVRGAAFGTQLNNVIGNAFSAAVAKAITWGSYSTVIDRFSYSVRFDNKAHVAAKVECKAGIQAALLRQMLGALAGVESLAVKAGEDQANRPFQNVRLALSDRIVELQMDAPIPNP
jgi:hypothetical protein